MARIGISERVRVAAVKARRARQAAASQLLGSRLLRWRYGRIVPRGLLIAPQDMRSRDPSFWPEVESGFFGLAGCVADLEGGSPFDAQVPHQAWLEDLHGFSWLRHIEAAANDDAEAWARDCVVEWIDRLRDHPPVAMAPVVRARRIISWLSAASVILDAAELDIFDLVTEGLSRDVQALSSDWRRAGGGEARLTALTALTLARLATDESDDDGESGQLATVVAMLGAEIDRQVLADGGHVSRNPAALIEVLLDWLPLKTCFEVRYRPVPPRLVIGIERALGMLRYLRLGDGGIARFNGMGVADPGALATLMAYDERPTPTWPVAGASRYARIARGKMIVIADVGPSPPLDVAGAACAGCLSFEASVGTALLFVNVGAPGAADADWHSISRATASHTAACLNETSSAHLVRDHGLQSVLQAVPLALDGQVRARAFELVADEAKTVPAGDDVADPVEAVDLVPDDPGHAKSGTMTTAVLEASHDGYVGRLGLTHVRTLSVIGSGEALSGVDQFERARRGGAHDVAFAVHFHLHPTTTAQTLTTAMAETVSLLMEPLRLEAAGREPTRAASQNQNSHLLLRLSDGSQWVFQSHGAWASIEESTFLAGSCGPRPALQIVLRGTFLSEARVEWSVTRLPTLAPAALPPSATTDTVEAAV